MMRRVTPDNPDPAQRNEWELVSVSSACRDAALQAASLAIRYEAPGPAGLRLLYPSFGAVERCTVA